MRIEFDYPDLHPHIQKAVAVTIINEVGASHVKEECKRMQCRLSPELLQKIADEVVRQDTTSSENDTAVTTQNGEEIMSHKVQEYLLSQFATSVFSDLLVKHPELNQMLFENDVQVRLGVSFAQIWLEGETCR